MKNRKRETLANKTPSKTARRRDKGQWEELTQRLLVSGLIPEKEMKLFKELWNESGEPLQEVWWDPQARVNKPTGKWVERGIPKDIKKSIDAQAELYATLEHYRWEVALTSETPGMLQAHFPVEKAYEGYRDLFFQQVYRMLQHLVLEDQSARLGSAALESRLRQFTAEMHQALRKFYGLPARAARRKEDLHRSWSRMNYEGLTGGQIADLERQEGRGTFAETHVNTSYARYRRRREPLQWVLRYLIYHAPAQS